jgi:tetratricopeptide (TPR) repeat protein
MEREARRQADSDLVTGSRNLARAAVALGRPESAVREAVEAYIASSPTEQQPTLRALYDALLAVVVGRFDVALQRLDAAETATKQHQVHLALSSAGGVVTTNRIRLLGEIGDDQAARSQARQVSESVALWEGFRGQSGGLGPFLWTLRVAGVPLDPRRADWVTKQLQSGMSGGSVWTFAWAMPAVTAEDGADALAELTKNPQLSLPRGGEVLEAPNDVDAPAGHVYLLAGRPADALPYLRRAAANCFVLVEPFLHMRALLDLALALEQTGDATGACAQYAKVLERWGHAKPHSVTADEARAHATKLGCAL